MPYKIFQKYCFLIVVSKKKKIIFSFKVVYAKVLNIFFGKLFLELNEQLIQLLTKTSKYKLEVCSFATALHSETLDPIRLLQIEFTF